MLKELTKDGRKSFFNPITGFGYIFARSDFHLKGRQSYILVDNPYQVLEIINNNAYKMMFLENFQHILLSIFNVADLSFFDVGDDFSDSRTNPFDEGEDDKDHGDPNVSTGPAKKIQQTFILYL